ncbi:MAG: hypothetical protein KKG47_03790 [Proteobacteria bacterium]|nr:hypothetical protein [Pseudomonadota bacterium]MBU1738069.1 hypothetical protein [Pseudomonadota bacterium]
MLYISIAIALFIAGYIALVIKGNSQFYAVGIIRAGEGKVNTQIILKQGDKTPLLAMALCYLAKIRWLIITEPVWSEKTFSNILNITVNNWPVVPNVEMLSSTKKDISEYKVTVFYSARKGWYVDNVIPTCGYYPGDLVTNYYFILKNILSELNEDEKILLGSMLSRFRDDILSVSDIDKSHRGLQRLLNKANLVLKNQVIANNS